MCRLTTVAALTALLCIAAPGKAGAQTQDLDRDCNPTSLRTACSRLADSVRSLESRIQSQQARLQRANPAMKPAIIRNITDLTRERDGAQVELRRCQGDYRAGLRQLAGSELDSTFTGTARVWTSKGGVEGPFTQDFIMRIRFTRNRCSFTISSSKGLNQPYPKVYSIPGVGGLTIEVTMPRGYLGSGEFHPVSGAMSMPIEIQVKLREPWLLIETVVNTKDSVFTKDPILRRGVSVAGRPLAADKRVTLVGETFFLDLGREPVGHSGRYRAWLVIEGKLDRRP